MFVTFSAIFQQSKSWMWNKTCFDFRTSTWTLPRFDAGSDEEEKEVEEEQTQRQRDAGRLRRRRQERRGEGEEEREETQAARERHRRQKEEEKGKEKEEEQRGQRFVIIKRFEWLNNRRFIPMENVLWRKKNLFRWYYLMY